MSLVDPALPSADVLSERLEFETLISDLSSRFLCVPTDEVDHAIEDALRRVCEFLDLDLAVLWQWSDLDPDNITPTHVHMAVEGPRPSEPMRQEQYPWCRREMLAGRPVVMSSLDELPAEASVDRETCRSLGIQSSLCLPLRVGARTHIGALGFNVLGHPREWPEALVRHLQLVAEILANALARHRHELSLQESEARLSLAADSAEAGLWTLDFATGAIWATERARMIFGYAPDETLDQARFETSVHSEDLDLVKGVIERAAKEGGPVSAEYRIVQGDPDLVRWIASRGRTRLSRAGEPIGLMGISIDVTERRRAEEALRLSEARLAAGADLAGLGFYEVDFGRNLMFSDERIRDLCGVPKDWSDGLQVLEFWLEHLHPDDRPWILEQRDRLHDGSLERLSIEYRFLHPTRGEVWIQHLAGATSRDASGRAIVTYGVLRDITKRRRTEIELRALGQRLIRAHEEERALLARELHDDLSQRLAVLAIEAGSAERNAAGQEQAQALRSIREGLVRISEDVHSLAYQLHPSVLEELGLAEALRTECERMGRKLRLDLSLDIGPLPNRVAKEPALCLFRVAQEALNNVARHAQASAASVTLREAEDGLRLVVRDDGVGFERAAAGRRRSLGLASMGERVRLLDGRLDIESAPGQGTSVIAWIPRPENAP